MCRKLTLPEQGEMLRAPARVWPALMEQRHRLAAPSNYSRKRWRGVAKATVRGTVAGAQQALMRREKRRKVLGHRKGVGEMESV